MLTPKFEVGDILTCSWLQALIKITAVEKYTDTKERVTIIQYRYNTWSHLRREWAPQTDNWDCFQSGSWIEITSKKANRLELLITLGVF